MGIFEIILISVGLAMDAFAVSVCKGLAIKKLELKKMLIIAVYFGAFQTLMPLLGYILGNSFQDIIYSIDHWIAFALLLGIGLNMIKECFSKDNEEKNDSLDFKTMIILAIATSIDALAVGITFGFLDVNLFVSVTLIGLITFVLSMIGVKIGNKFGDKFQNKAEIAGGVILILIGIKILMTHLRTG